jgi:hypothetical protein
MQHTEASKRLRQKALETELAGNLQQAGKLYSKAAEAVDREDFKLRARLRIDAARTAILQGEAFEGIAQMERMLTQKEARKLTGLLQSEARATCALGLYYAAYALRLDNPQPEMWKQEALEAHTLFRELYEDAVRKGRENDATFYARNLEACIILERSKLAEIAINPPPPAALAARDKSIFQKKLDRLERGS